MSEARTPRRRTWIPFALLCGVGAFRWLLPAAWPGAETTPLSLLVGATLYAVLACGAAIKSEAARPVHPQLLWAVAGGALLVAGFDLPVLVAEVNLRSSDATIALALTPVVLAVAQGALGAGNGLPERLWPGLAACAGLLLLLPQPVLQNPVTVTGLFAMPLLCGVGAALLAEINLPTGWARAGASVGALLVAAAALAAWHGKALAGTAQSFEATPQGSWTGEHVAVVLIAALLDAAQLLLSLWALLSLGAARWSGQFALVPLLLVLEGLLFLRPALDVRSLGGIGLLLLASYFLLRASSEDGELDGLITLLP